MRQGPRIWRALGRCVHQDFLLQFPDFRSGFEDFLREASQPDLEELSAFVGEVLSSDLADRDLAELWNGNGAAYLVDEDGGRAMLQMVFDTIEAIRGQRGAS